MATKSIHSLNMALQAAKIKSLFPGSNLRFDQNELVWYHRITPSSLSGSYDIELVYIRNEHPNVYVKSPHLDRFPGANKLMHVYDTDKQWLCLYRRKTRQWAADMFISDTIIPWTCEWLLNHELWVATGVWYGGGIHVTSEVEKLRFEKENDEISQ